ncbi:tape measure protein [Chryseobacterium arthrosphaerae]
MANNGGDLSVGIGGDPSGFLRALNEAQTALQRFRNNVERLGDVGRDLQDLGRSISTFVTVPILGLGASAIKAYGDLQSLELGIEAVAGSASYAAKQMEDLKEIAKLPGLGLNEAAKGSVGLQAIGYSAGNAKKILSQFGNAIATVGKGRVEFERAIYGVQQLANTDFPLGEDLNIIKDALPQVSTLLKAAFGTSRSEDLQKLKISSQQVMEVIIAGLEKLPRVSGGIKNAFENLKDSMTQNLARVGEIIDKNLNISGVINKLTEFIDKAISKFEGLSKPVQELVLIFGLLAAATGPVLLGIGGILAILPTLVNGFVAVRAAVVAFNTALLTNPYLAAGAAILSLVSAFAIYKASIETAADRTDRWNETLAEARSNARAEIADLEVLYKKTQDHTLSIEERNAAVDQIQKEYPYYFANLKDEAILAGNAAGQYKELRSAILRASLARAAQKELDTRAEKMLQKEVEVRTKLAALFKVQKINNTAARKEYIKEYENAMTTTEKLLGNGLNPFANSALESDEEIKANAKRAAKNLLKSYAEELRASNQENRPLLDILNKGAEDIKNLDTPGVNSFLPGLAKVKKEKEKQLAEIYPLGSIAELKQRADLLKKAIDTSNNDIVKVRKLDIFGKETDKKGQPFFTGEILSVEQARDRLEQLLAQISLLEVKPPQGITNFTQFRESFTSELNGLKNAASGFTFNFTANPFEQINKNIDSLGNSIGKVENFKSAITTNLQQLSTDVPTYLNMIGDSFLMLPQKLAFGIDSSKVKAEDFTKLAESFKKDFENMVSSSVTNGLTDMFSSIGEAIGNGGNVMAALGNGILKMFGSFLSDMGGLLIKYGTLAVVKGTLDEAIQKSGNPYVTIAAGIAAIAVGAALSVAGGAIGARAKSNSGGSTSTNAGADYTGNNYSSNYTSGGGYGGGGEVVFRLSGYELKGVLDRVNGKNNRLNAGN